MAEVIGIVATAPETRWSQGPKRRKYYSFRLAENIGKGEKRKTTWYTVRARIAESTGTQLCVGQMVRVRGRLDSDGYVSRRAIPPDMRIPRTWGGIIQALQRCAALESAIVLITSCVEPYERSREPSNEEEGAED